MNQQFTWPTVTMIPPLHSGSVHVWSIDLAPHKTAWDRRASVLSGDERNRAARRRLEHARVRYVAARGALRMILASYTRLAPADLAFTYGPRGKPTLQPLAGAAPLHFNISHSGDVGLLAVSEVGAVGVDLELVRPRRNVDGIVRRFFHPEEAGELAALHPPARLTGFYRCWTRKEACVKAVGAGIYSALSRFVVTVDEQSPRLKAFGEDRAASARWSMHHLEPAPEFIASVAVIAPGTSFQLGHWTDDNKAPHML